MINTPKIVRFLTLNIGLAAIVLISGHFAGTYGQASSRDPFAKPGWAKTREVKAGSVKKTGSNIPIDASIPTIEARIAFFKRLRENAATNGQPLPKVTSVLTLDELAVTGIFQTPRGYAAMVEATPIKLSYTIYPGEKFFDGQLVAVEENRLVFRRVTKTGKDKFTASVENKTLRQYSTQEEVQGTAPVQTEGRPPETVATYPRPADGTGTAAPVATSSAPATKPAATPTSIVSPLDEMNKQMPETTTAKEKAKASKKPVKVASKNK